MCSKFVLKEIPYYYEGFQKRYIKYIKNNSMLKQFCFWYELCNLYW